MAFSFSSATISEYDILHAGVMHCQEMKMPTEVGGTAELRVPTARHSEEDNPAASRWWIDNPGLPLLAVESCPVTSKLSRDPFAAESDPPSYAPSGGGNKSASISGGFPLLHRVALVQP